MSDGLRTIKLKLVPSDDTKFLYNMINIAGIIYNTAITIESEYYKETGLYLNKYDLQKTLKEMKGLECYDYWSTVNSQSIQDITDRIDRAFKLFFSNKKKGVKSAPPKRRKVKKYHSVTFKQCGYKVLTNSKIKIGRYIYNYYDSYEGLLERVKIHTLTVKRNTIGEFFIYATIESDLALGEIKENRTVIGIDFGLKTFLTLSNGEKIKSPLFLKESLKQIKKANKEVSSKEKGSSNRRKALLKLARLHIDVKNKRRDFFWKKARELCSKYNIICIEDLNLKGMQRLWGRKVSDVSYGEFLQILESSAKKAGSIIIKIDRYYPSSKLCNRCGNIKEELSLKDRIYSCSICGHEEDRDINAAKNILEEGLRILKMKTIA